MDKSCVCCMGMSASYCSETFNFIYPFCYLLCSISFYKLMCPYGSTQMSLAIGWYLYICILEHPFCFVEKFRLHHQVGFTGIWVIPMVRSNHRYKLPPLVKCCQSSSGSCIISEPHLSSTWFCISEFIYQWSYGQGIHCHCQWIPLGSSFTWVNLPPPTIKSLIGAW